MDVIDFLDELIAKHASENQAGDDYPLSYPQARQIKVSHVRPSSGCMSHAVINMRKLVQPASTTRLWPVIEITADDGHSFRVVLSTADLANLVRTIVDLLRWRGPNDDKGN